MFGGTANLVFNPILVFFPVILVLIM